MVGALLEEVGSDNILGRELVGFSPRAAMSYVRSNGLLNLGRLEEARSALSASEHVAEGAREIEVLSWILCTWATLASVSGAGASALKYARRGLELAEKLDIEASRVGAYWSLGVAYLLDGQPAAARDALRDAAAIARDRHTQLGMLGAVLGCLAEAQVALGEPTEAVVTAREAIEITSSGDFRYLETSAQLALAGALLTADGPLPRAEIEAALERAEELVESIDARSLSPRILEQRGRLAAALGDAPASDRTLREARDLYRAIGATGHAERLGRELGMTRRPA